MPVPENRSITIIPENEIAVPAAFFTLTFLFVIPISPVRSNTIPARHCPNTAVAIDIVVPASFTEK